LEKIIAQGGEHEGLARALQGQVAIANAKAAYQVYKEVFGGDRFRRLAGKGARTQRLLWASTGTKNPAYSDVKYVEALIGRDTIDTVPVETLDDYRDHGRPEDRLEQDVAQSMEALGRLPELGIDLGKVTEQLEDEGVEKFNRAFDELMQVLDKAVASVAP
jgi:transaldolase